MEAATRQMRKLPFYHQFASKAHDTAIDLAERLIELDARPDVQGVLQQLGLRGQ